MCYTCEMLLRDEHKREALARAKKVPCPKCKVFAAGDPLPPARRRKGAGPQREMKPRYQTCYHCWTKANLHEECPICKKGRVQ